MKEISLLLNVVVLVFEILYYTLFMKFARKEGKFWRYLLLFSAITIFFYFVGTKHIFSYLSLILMMLYGLKFIVKIKISLYDMLVITIMCISKSIIEIPLFYLFSIMFNGIVSTFLFQISKIGIILILRNKMNVAYNYLKTKWNNNNFYIRYIFSIALFSYVIISCFFLILR